MTDATGVPTNPDLIPTFNTSADAPSGLGFNTAMAQIQAIITNLKAGTLASGKLLASALSGVIPTANLGSGVASASNFLRGDQTWASAAATRDYTEVTRSAVLSVANATATPVGFDTETIDDNNKHDNVTNNSRITFATSGLFLVGAYTDWAANGTGGRYALVRLNGVTTLAALDAAAGGAVFSTGDSPVVVTHSFATNDYIELVVEQTSGVALNLAANTKLWATRLV